jgi:VanZ family protein
MRRASYLLSSRGGRFLPPLLWMAVIALGSSSFLSGERTTVWLGSMLGHLGSVVSPAVLGVTHLGLRKLAHLIEFGILAVLWHRALGPSPHTSALVITLTAAYGGVDELRQALVPTRGPAVTDVMVDTLGGILGLAAWTEPGPLRARTLRGAACGTGFLTALALLGLAIDSALGRPVAAVGGAGLGLGAVTAGLARRAREARIRTARDRRNRTAP